MSKKVCLDKNLQTTTMDRISSLPDAILQHILSFLDTKHAVQTCILSRRWSYVWTNVPCLDFNFERMSRKTLDFSEERRNSFANFMHMVLTRRCKSDILKFSFSSSIAVDAGRFRSIVNHVMKRNVQIVEIRYSNMAIPYHTSKKRRFLDPFELPCRMYTSESLRVLKLTASDKGSIVLPETLTFTSLKELHLCDISLWDNTSNRELISNCPNLERLTLENCDFGELKSLKISAPELSILEILFPLDECVLASPAKCNVIVSAPKLSSFKYDSDLPLLCTMGNPLYVDAIDINIETLDKKISKEYNEELACQLITMLREFQHAKSVTLSLSAIKILSGVPGVLDHQSSPFCNLRNFNLNCEDSSFWHGLNYLFRNSPCAQGMLRGSTLRFDMEDKAKR